MFTLYPLSEKKTFPTNDAKYLLNNILT